MNKPKIICEILQKLEPFATNPENIRPYNCWLNALDITDNTSCDLLKLRTKLASTVYEIVEILESDAPDVYDKTWVNDLVTLFTMQIHEPTPFFVQLKKIYPHTKNMIAVQIRLWDHLKGKTKNIDFDELKKLKEKTNELVESLIINDSLDQHAKAFCIKQLKKIIDVIDHYNIYGNEGILDIVEESIGHAFTNKKYHDYMKDEKSADWRKYLNDLSAIVATSDSILSIGTTLRSLIP